MSRRDFMGFFLAGGLVSLLFRRAKVVGPARGDAPAMFWKKL
jgi:hypothetical protein